MSEAQQLDFSTPKQVHFVVVFNEHDNTFSIDWDSTYYDLHGGVWENNAWRKYDEREAKIADALRIRIETPQKAPRRPIESNVVRIGRRSPETSLNAAERLLPRTGTKRKTVYDLILSAGSYVLCDHEIEAQTGWLHQSASSIRNGLMNDGWIKDSGLRRNTPQGNKAIVWVVAQ